MITTKLIFDRKKQAKKDGTGTIEVRVISNRKVYYISTGVRIREKEWRAGMIINRPDAQSLNERIAIICQIINTEVNRCIEANIPISTENLKSKVWTVKDAMSNEPSFLDWLDHQTEILNLSAGTIKHYVTLHTRLTEYGKIKRWGDLTTENISEFDAWLHKRKLSNGEAITDAAVYKYHKCFKAILNRAVMFDKIDRNPYDRLKFRRGENENIEYFQEKNWKLTNQNDISGFSTSRVFLPFLRHFGIFGEKVMTWMFFVVVIFSIEFFVREFVRRIFVR